MNTVRIYLRSVKIGEKHKLALFDSNRNAGIAGTEGKDDFGTDVRAGDTVIWKLDRCSGIRRVTGIFAKPGKVESFIKVEPRKRLFCKGFRLQIPQDAKPGDTYHYNISYTHCDGDEPVIIDPYIRVKPT